MEKHLDSPLGENDNVSEFHRLFVRQVLLIIHGSHSHNVSGSLKRLKEATDLFHSVSQFSPESEALLNEIIDDLSTNLLKLRYISSTSDIQSLKNGCLSQVRRLHSLSSDIATVDDKADFTENSVSASSL